MDDQFVFQFRNCFLLESASVSIIILNLRRLVTIFNQASNTVCIFRNTIDFQKYIRFHSQWHVATLPIFQIGNYLLRNEGATQRFLAIGAQVIMTDGNELTGAPYEQELID